MSDLVLSPGVRGILLSLQNAAAQMTTVQNRLATGKKVNSALDKPSSYFTARALDARAGDLSALVDRMSRSLETLKAASTGIDGIAKLVQAAKSLALQARQAPLAQTSYDAIEQTGSTDVSGEVVGDVTGNIDVSGAFQADISGLKVQVGATTYTVAAPSGNVGTNTIINAINGTAGLNGAVHASLDASGQFIKLTATSSDTSFQVLSSSAAAALGIDGLSGTSTNLLQAVGGLSGTSMTVQANGGGAKTVTFGTGAGQISSLAELRSALGGAGVSASLNGTGLSIGVAGTVAHANSLTTSGSALAVLGLPAAGTDYGTVNAPTPDPTRTAAQEQYNALLQQIDQMAADASFGGINLLGGDSLLTTFNESGSSTLTVAGFGVSTAGLNLTAASGDDFQSNGVIDGLMPALDAALATLRQQAASLGANLGTLQIRQTFTNNMINTLQGAADGLVLADTNEEGANLLALQTRQGLSLTSLSLATQSNQAVLQLFR